MRWLAYLLAVDTPVVRLQGKVLFACNFKAGTENLLGLFLRIRSEDVFYLRRLKLDTHAQPRAFGPSALSEAAPLLGLQHRARSPWPPNLIGKDVDAL